MENSGAGRKPILFISHASEDKDAFVRPLNIALTKEGVETWLDEIKIKLGDSLRRSIDDGLKKADYGVVVLSKAFFQKDWTQRELNALFALEDQNRKVILPVWLGVTKDDVTKFSPLLADKKAVSGDRGIEAVVEAILAAVALSDRQNQVTSVRNSSSALRSLNELLFAKEAEAVRVRASDASQRVIESARQVSEEMKAIIIRSVPEGSKARYTVHAGHHGSTTINGPFSVFLYLYPYVPVINDATAASLSAKIGKGANDGYSNTKASTLKEMIFKPRMVEDGVVHWQLSSDKNSMMTAIEVADYAVHEFISKIAGLA